MLTLIQPLLTLNRLHREIALDQWKLVVEVVAAQWLKLHGTAKRVMCLSPSSTKLP